MIFLTFLCQMLRVSGSQIIDKTIYLIEGEQYKVDLDSIFKEDQENTYSFNSSNKGFTLNTSSLKLKSQGAYLQLPTKIIRQRQLVHIEDNQGQGQYGILDQHDEGNRICYNNNTSIINLDQCLELDNTATSYDFVFIAKDTIAVSKVRVSDQQFGVTIYQNKEIISELYFIPSKTYTQVTKTITEYCVFGQNKYLLIGVTEEDSNIEFLEIKDDFILVNTNKVIDKQLLQQKQALQVYDVRSILNMVYIVYNDQNQEKLIISFKFETNWIQTGFFLSQDFRAIELGYNFIYRSVIQTQLICQQYSCSINSNNKSLIVKNLTQQIKPSAQVRYTLNYLIILQDNNIIVTNLQKSAQITNQIEGTLLRIDVDFQNDILIVFTDTKIVEYYLKQPTLSYSSNIITNSLELVTIQAKSDTYEQIANIQFQVLSKVDYNIYQQQDFSRDLYYNRYFEQANFSIPIYGISGADIKVDLKVDDQIQMIPKNQFKYGIQTQERFKWNIIQELLITNIHDPYLIRQYDDFQFSIYKCKLNFNSYYQCQQAEFTDQFQKQRLIVEYFQVADQYVQLALLNSDGLQISILNIKGLVLYKYIKTSKDNQFVDMKVGTDRLFVYTINYFIQFYYFPSGEFINKMNLTQYGQPSGEEIKKLWVNQVKSNLLIITYGEDLIIGRFTTQFNLMQRITIKWVFDVQIISDNKFIVLSTDKTNKKLTQYIIEDGVFRIIRELDTHGYVITGDNMLSDYVFGEIMIEAQKGSQRAILVFGDSELERDSLLKIIQLQNDEFPANVIYNQQKSMLLIRTTDSEKNSSIIELNYTHQVFDTNLTKIPNYYSQKLGLKYYFGSSFSENKIEIDKHFHLEYQFYNITVKQSDKIAYQNENQFNIEPDTFQGQVEKIQIISNDTRVKLTTRFKNNRQLHTPSFFQCKQVFKFQRIICLTGSSVIYLNINGNIISSLNIQIFEFLIQIILHSDDQYALIHSEDGQLFLIYVSENAIQLSSTTYKGWQSSLHNSIFHKNWLVVSNETKISYYKFLIYENDLWSLEKQHENLILGIQVIQYDPQTEQIFYSKGDQNLYYFKSSLDGDTINIQLDYSLNLLIFLKKEFQNIDQLDLTIQNIKIISNMQSYILVTTSYGNIWNITIKSFSQDFTVNNMYIVNGPYPIVYDIQLLNEYMIVQNDYFQTLYKNTNDWQINKPYLSLEGIRGSKLIGLFKNGSKIIHLYIDNSENNLYQTTIDDDIYLTVQNLTSQTPGNLQIQASNSLGFALVNYQLVKDEEQDTQLVYILLVIFGIIFVVLVIAIIFYYKKKKKQKIEEEIEFFDYIQN